MHELRRFILFNLKVKMDKYYALGNQILGLAWSLIVLVYTNSTVGLYGYGLFVKASGIALLLQMITQFGYPVFGIVDAVKVKNIKASQYYLNSMIIRLGMGGIVGLIMFPLVTYFEMGLTNKQTALALIMGMLLALESGWAFAAAGRFFELFLINVCVKSFGLIVLSYFYFNLVQSVDDVLIVLTITAFAQVLIQMKCLMRMDIFSLRALKFDFLKAKNNFFSSIMISAYTAIPNFFWASVLDVKLAAVYGMGERVYGIFATLKEAIGGVYLQRHGRGDKSAVVSYLKNTIFLYALSTLLLAFVCICLAEQHLYSDYAIDTVMEYASIRLLCLFFTTLSAAEGLFRVAKNEIPKDVIWKSSIFGCFIFLFATQGWQKEFGINIVAVIFLVSEIAVYSYYKIRKVI